MTTPATSSIEAINAALLTHNPFSQPPFVNANNVWGKGFPDVESLNAHASDAVFKALDEIRAGRYPTASILITAQNGTGKTHIISRIRHRLQSQGGALFIFANKFNDLNHAKQGFQQILADSLSNIGSQGVKQWQELATSMANDVFQFLNSDFEPWEAKNLVKKMEGSSEQQINTWITKLTKAFCKSKAVQDPDIIRAIFWTLSEDESSYASNWLAGKELAQFKANELKLPNQNQSFDATLQILSLISEYYELVLCFDELDVYDINDAGLYKAQVVASLVKELFDNLKRGVVLTVIMPGIWKQMVQDVMPESVAQKMTTFCSPLELQYLDSDSTVELISFFLKEYYEARELIPPHPVYPFDKGQLQAIGREKPTIREVLKWCREHCNPPLISDIQDSTASLLEVNPVELAFTNELSEEIKQYLDDNHFLAEALLLGFESLIGQTVEKVTIKEVTTNVTKKGGRDHYLNFKIIGHEEDKEVSLGVAVLQYDGGRAFGAGLRRLLDKSNQFRLTRGCLVRSKDKPVNFHFRKNYLDPLVATGGEFVKLHENEIKPLIAIRSVYQKRESDYQVTEEEIFKFIEEKGARYWLGAHNPLLKEILSDPSYQVPDDLEDEPESLAEDFADTSELSESDDLQELVIHA